MKNKSDYFQRATKYNLLAEYYKYTDPARQIEYYQKHLKYMNKVLWQNRTMQQTNPVHVRFLNATKDIANIDIFTNGRLLIKDLPFKNITPYYVLDKGKHHLDIYPAGTQVSTIINKNIDLESNQTYTLATVSTNDKLQLLTFEDFPNETSKDTKVKFIHLTSDYPSVNVSIKYKETLFDNISYKKSSEYKLIEPMTTKIEVMDCETKKIIDTMENVLFTPSKIVTIFFIDSKIVLA